MRALVTTAIVVVLDQVSKHLVRQHLDLHRSLSVLGNFFKLTYVENRGIAFGIDVGGTLPLFTGLSILAIGFIFAYLYQERSSHLAVRVSLALILGGAIGNLIDRIIFGRVVDFLDFGLGAYRFFVFNLADTAVTVGVAFYLVLTIIIFPRVNQVETDNS